MLSRERVMRALNHKETDKIPVDFGGTVVTSMDRNAHINLKKFLKIKDNSEKIIDYSMGTVDPCEKLKIMFGSDFRRVSLNYADPEITDGMFENGFGVRFKKAEPHDYYEMIYHPLAESEIEDIDGMKMPDPDDESLYFGLAEKAKDLYENTSYAIIADFGVPGFYETSQKLRGYENLACDLIINQDYLKVLYDKLFDLQKRFFKNYLDRVGKYVQIIGYADDLGMQDRLQMSPQVYREIIKQYHKKIFRFIHEQADVKILLHCCGSIRPLIGDLIDAGVDILNPLQTNAADMDPAALKNEFGSRICFWGGIDEQYLLPQGTREQIFAEVEKMIRVMGENNGYVIAPSHNFQDDTPAENVIAMYEATNRYRYTGGHYERDGLKRESICCT